MFVIVVERKMSLETCCRILGILVVFASLPCAISGSDLGPCPLNSRVEEADTGCDTCRCCRFANGEYKVTCKSFIRVPPLSDETTYLLLNNGTTTLRRSSFPLLPKLNRLGMTAFVSGATNDAFQNLPELTSLDIPLIGLNTVPTSFFSSAPKLRHLSIGCWKPITDEEFRTLFRGLELSSLTITNCNMSLDHRFPLEIHPENLNFINIAKTSATDNIQLPGSNVVVTYEDSETCPNMSDVHARSFTLRCSVYRNVVEFGDRLGWIDKAKVDTNVSVYIDVSQIDISGNFQLGNHSFHSLAIQFGSVSLKIKTFVQDMLKFMGGTVVQRLYLELPFQYFSEYTGPDFISQLITPQLSVLEIIGFIVGPITNLQFPNNLRKFYCIDCELSCPKCRISEGLRTLNLASSDGSHSYIAFDIQNMLSVHTDLVELIVTTDQFEYANATSLSLPPHLRLRRLDLSSQTRTTVYKSVNISGLVNLEFFRIRYGDFGEMEVLKTFTVSGLRKLTYFEFSYNSLRLHGSMESVFAGLDSLRDLRLVGQGEIPFWGDSANSLAELLHPISGTLENLDLSGNQINNLLSSTFAYMTELKYLNLSENNLAKVDGCIFRNSIMISHLDFTGNKLEKMNNEGVECLERLLYLRDMYLGNPKLRCVCENRKLRDWVKHSTETGTVDFRYDVQVCPASDKSEMGSFLLFRMPWLDCDFHREGVALGGTALGLLLIVSAISIYYFRWDIAFWWVVKRRHRLNRRHNVNPSRRFHAFLSYASTEQLLAERMFFELEEGQDVKFRIAYDCRDFMPGETIADNIIRCIDQSEKVIFLISRQFLERDWTTFELNFAQMRCFDHRRNMIILIFVEKFESNALPQRIRALCRHVNYLEYPDPGNTRATQNFWHRLRLALAQDSDLYNAQDPINPEHERGEEIPDIPDDEEQDRRDYQELMTGRRANDSDDDLLGTLEDVDDEPDTSDDERPLV